MDDPPGWTNAAGESLVGPTGIVRPQQVEWF